MKKDNLEKKATREEFEKYLVKLAEDAVDFMNLAKTRGKKAGKNAEELKDALGTIQNAEAHRKRVQQYIRDYKKEKKEHYLEYYSKKNPDGTMFYYFEPKK